MSRQHRPRAECGNKNVTFHPFLETPDQYMHHANTNGASAPAKSANGSLTPMFHSLCQSRGCRPAPRRADARSTAFGFAPKPPSGGFSPPVPPGEAGGDSLPHLYPQPHELKRRKKLVLK